MPVSREIPAKEFPLIDCERRTARRILFAAVIDLGNGAMREGSAEGKRLREDRT
jgi:hypothetical protein